ncbi:MAG: ribonuclease PH [Nitrospinae bacterium]|nr:ribonuclease PH [Nitrospinota bacterium]
MRADGRTDDALRPVTIEIEKNIHAEGSCLISVGGTQVLCVATVEEEIPSFLRGSGKGWVTAEYSMLPRATHTRMKRERREVGGRTMEIQRLIARSLRAVVDQALLGERTITVDCDVIQADGGTRCASITGAYVALRQAMNWLMEKDRIGRMPLKDQVAAVSVGVGPRGPLLDLDYREDSSAHVDMNIVLTGSGKFVEIQGTAEAEPFDEETMGRMVALARKGTAHLFEIQRRAVRH